MHYRFVSITALLSNMLRLEQKIRQALDAAFSVDAGEGAFGFGQEFVAAKEAVLVVDACGAGTDGADLQAERVPEAAGAQVFARDLVDDQDDTVSLQLRIVIAQREELLDAGQLEILKIVRVMDEALGVGFVVANADFNFVVGEHGIF